MRARLGGEVRGGGTVGEIDAGTIQRVTALFDESCARFTRLVVDADEVADATDFTGKLHELSLTAGQVQGLAEALAVFTGDLVWRDRATATLREYLEPSTSHEEAVGRGNLAGTEDL